MKKRKEDEPSDTTERKLTQQSENDSGEEEIANFMFPSQDSLTMSQASDETNKNITTEFKQVGIEAATDNATAKTVPQAEGMNDTVRTQVKYTTFLGKIAPFTEPEDIQSPSLLAVNEDSDNLNAEQSSNTESNGTGKDQQGELDMPDFDSNIVFELPPREDTSPNRFIHLVGKEMVHDENDPKPRRNTNLINFQTYAKSRQSGIPLEALNPTDGEVVQDSQDLESYLESIEVQEVDAVNVNDNEGKPTGKYLCPKLYLKLSKASNNKSIFLFLDNDVGYEAEGSASEDDLTLSEDDDSEEEEDAAQGDKNSETDDSEMEDEMPETVHGEQQNDDSDNDDCKPNSNIGWPDEYQQSFYARIGEKLHGLFAKHTVSDKCASEIWNVVRNLFDEQDAAMMKGYKAVRDRNYSILPTLYVDTHYQDRNGVKHVLKNQLKYPRKFIESNKFKLMTVITHYRLPDIIRVIQLIHENMEKHDNGEETDEDEDEWVARLGRRGIRLKQYRAQNEPGEASFVQNEEEIEEGI